MEKNPFEILGITPELVKKLDNEQLFKLVQSNYRLLQKAFHPDVASASSKNAHAMAVQLNKAFEQLNIKKDVESFELFRKLYEQRLKRGFRKQIDEQKEQLQTLTNQLSNLSNHSFRFLLHYLEDWGARKNGAILKSGSSVFHLADVTLGIFDVAVGYNLRQSSLNLGKNYKEMQFDDSGNMKYRFLCRSDFSPVNFIRLMGAVKADTLDIIPLLDKKLTKAATLDGNRSARQYAYGMYEVLNTIDLDVFREELMPYLSPELAENCFLFSIHLCNGKSVLREVPVKVVLEGKIIKVSSGATEKQKQSCLR